MKMRTIIRGSGCLLALTLFLNCTGNTGNDSAQQAAQAGEVFQADSSNTGTVTLSVQRRSMRVSETSSFIVEALDLQGQPLRQLPIECDTEQGLALIEPTTGTFMTDNFGAASGVVGCSAPGSFQMACRLGLGANRRVFAPIRCDGPVPPDFTGFEGATGGGLFGGVGNVDDDIDADRRLEITAIQGIGVAGSGFEIDVVFNPDCDGDPDTDDPEPYGGDSVALTLRNNGNREARLVGAFFVVPNVGGVTFTSPLLTGNTGGEGDLIADNGAQDLVLTIPFTDGSAQKTFVGSSTPIPPDTGFRNVTFRVQVEFADGEELTASARAGFRFANYDRCGG